MGACQFTISGSCMGSSPTHYHGDSVRCAPICACRTALTPAPQVGEQQPMGARSSGGQEGRETVGEGQWWAEEVAAAERHGRWWRVGGGSGSE